MQKFTLNCNGTLLTLTDPIVMGILNITPDSFSDGGQFNTLEKAIRRTEEMISEGASIIDVGGYSSRPNAAHISLSKERTRLYPVIQKIRAEFPEVLISVDTFRAEIAEEMIAMGVHLINDISGGLMDEKMMETVGRYPVPYIIMHMQGTPQTMQTKPEYQDITKEVWVYFTERVQTAKTAGIKDLVIDPGFGFGKKMSHNYTLLNHLSLFTAIQLPLMVGLSRKSMIYKLLNISPQETLPFTTALHLKAMEKGAKILRVHEVETAVKAVSLYQLCTEPENYST